MFKTSIDILFGKRREGKTTEILKSVKDGDCIITTNRMMANHLDSLIPYWIDVKVFSPYDDLRGYNFNNIYIDDADLIIKTDSGLFESILEQCQHHNIEFITMSLGEG